MDLWVGTVAERLTHEFPHLAFGTVVRGLVDCVHDYPDADSHFIEQAVRARLRALPGSSAEGAGAVGRDPLDVSLHDVELAVEVELTATLMVAANESDKRLTQAHVDRLLGVRRRPGGGSEPPVPSQRDRRR